MKRSITLPGLRPRSVDSFQRLGLALPIKLKAPLTPAHAGLCLNVPRTSALDPLKAGILLTVGAYVHKVAETHNTYPVSHEIESPTKSSQDSSDSEYNKAHLLQLQSPYKQKP